MRSTNAGLWGLAILVLLAIGFGLGRVTAPAAPASGPAPVTAAKIELPRGPGDLGATAPSEELTAAAERNRRLEEANEAAERELASLRAQLQEFECFTFEGNKKIHIHGILTPASLGEVTPEEQGRKCGLNEDYWAASLSDEDFERFIRANVDWRLEQMSVGLGRDLAVEEREAVHRVFTELWLAFREWRRTEYLEAVQGTTNTEEYNQAVAEYIRRSHQFHADLVKGVHGVFRATTSRESMELILRWL